MASLSQPARVRRLMLRVGWLLAVAAISMSAVAVVLDSWRLWVGTLAVAGAVVITVLSLPEVRPEEVGAEGPAVFRSWRPTTAR